MKSNRKGARNFQVGGTRGVLHTCWRGRKSLLHKGKRGRERKLRVGLNLGEGSGEGGSNWKEEGEEEANHFMLDEESLSIDVRRSE